jgi:hypothetical protein
LIGDSYTANTETGWYLLGKASPPVAVSGAEQGVRYTFHGSVYSSAYELMTAMNPARRARRAGLADDFLFGTGPTVKYPMHVGDEWDYGRLFGVVVAVRKVTGRTFLEMPWGREECYVIEVRYDLDGDGAPDEDIEFVDFVSEKGLMRSHSIARDIVKTTYSDPYGSQSGMVDIDFETLATSVHIPELP